jgi:hypothetical protein
VEYTRSRSLLQERLLATLAADSSVLGVILATSGTYGLLSYVLSLRRKELGCVAVSFCESSVARVVPFSQFCQRRTVS